jgi:hypothetical protein
MFMRALAVATLFCVALAASAAAKDEAPASMSQEEMMKAYEAAAAPGQAHAMLAKSAGRWNATVKSWHDPAGEPMVSTGTEDAEMIFGGRYLKSHFKGSMMGQAYEGMGTMGYDNGKKKYVGTWFDSMGTGIMSYEGDYDAQKKELVCLGSYVDPVMGMESKVRLVTRFVSDDEHVFEFWGPDPASGKQLKWMEIAYKRAK